MCVQVWGGNVNTHDATFLTGDYRGVCCNIVCPFSGNANLVDIFTVDSDNESLNALNFQYETKSYVLGERSSAHIDIFDRFPGLSYLYKE